MAALSHRTLNGRMAASEQAWAAKMESASLRMAARHGWMHIGQGRIVRSSSKGRFHAELRRYQAV